MVGIRAPSCESNYIASVYGSIKNGDYDEAVQILEAKLTNFPKSRAALSLLGYCCYNQQDYSKAATTYERLVKVCPDVEQYRIHHAQSLFRAGSYVEADRAASRIDSQQYTQRISMLRASIKYEQEELDSCRAILDDCLSDDPETVIALASVCFREGKFQDAWDKYADAMDMIGYRAELAYNIALCHYKLQNYKDARSVINGIIERALRDHPELMVQGGSRAKGHAVRTSVGNSRLLQESYLVEAFNLRSAIAYDTKNIDEAKDALSEMPPRDDEELDPVTLHNQALFHLDDDATASLQKMNFLVANPPFPPETFGNLLLLQCKYGYHDVAAGVLAENAHLTHTLLSEELFEFLDVSIMVKTSPEEAYDKLEDLTSKYLEKLRKLAKTVSAAHSSRNSDDIMFAQRDFDNQIDKYLPVLMAHANMYWENANYPMVERILRQSAEFCGENETWSLNVAHAIFMQQDEGKFRDAVCYYEQIVTRGIENSGILGVQAIVLANLCVAYLMTEQKEIAQDLMNKIKTEEDGLSCTEPNEPLFHSCIVGLVIGTLYCEKGNYEFGMERICGSLEPYDRKLGPDTWFYAKRCFLALAESMSKNLLIVEDNVMRVIMPCLEKLTQHGKGVPATIIQELEDTEEGGEEFGAFNTTVAYESRQLKPFFMKLID